MAVLRPQTFSNRQLKNVRNLTCKKKKILQFSLFLSNPSQQNCKCHGHFDLKTAITLLHISSIREYSVSHRSSNGERLKLQHPGRAPSFLPPCKISRTISRLSGSRVIDRRVRYLFNFPAFHYSRARRRIKFLRAIDVARHPAGWFPAGLAGSPASCKILIRMLPTRTWGENSILPLSLLSALSQPFLTVFSRSFRPVSAVELLHLVLQVFEFL